MPVKKKISNSVVVTEDDMPIKNIDVQYNPDIVANLLKELQLHTESKCAQIQRDAEFMITSMQQDFYMELIKLPTQVKQMSIKRFKEEFGYSLEAITRGVMAGNNEQNSLIEKGLVTPAGKKVNYAHARNPREGELIVSVNGSPLGSFSTVKKPPRPLEYNGVMPPPPTPGVYMPLPTGEVVDLDSLSEDNLQALSVQDKQKALLQMEAVMENMKSLMQKLKGSSQE
eukprot:gene10477-11607_t